MSILVQVLLTFLVLSACLTPRMHTLRTNMLKESIRLLDQLQQVEVSCNQMNVTNIFTDYEVSLLGDFSKPLMKANSSQGENNTEILCKAATIAREGQSCHRPLEGVYHNLLSLAWGSGAGHKRPCPVTAGSTTSLKNFLKELYQVLQKEYKYQK